MKVLYRDTKTFPNDCCHLGMFFVGYYYMVANSLIDNKNFILRHMVINSVISDSLHNK